MNLKEIQYTRDGVLATAALHCMPPGMIEGFIASGGRLKRISLGILAAACHTARCPTATPRSGPLRPILSTESNGALPASESVEQTRVGNVRALGTCLRESVIKAASERGIAAEVIMPFIEAGLKFKQLMAGISAVSIQVPAKLTESEIRAEINRLRLENEALKMRKRRVIFRASRTNAEGKVLYARDYGYRAWPIHLRRKDFS